MKKMPMLILVPFIAIMGVVVVAMALKLFTPKADIAVTRPTEFPSVVEMTQDSKPSTFLGGLFGQKVTTPTPSPATASDLSRELKDTYDDGGQAELDAISKDASNL